jgi:hypothetical protein
MSLLSEALAWQFPSFWQFPAVKEELTEEQRRHEETKEQLDYAITGSTRDAPG